ncbi:MAG: gliding motility lipoprotein GldH [Mangrovibacterium sp.]
MKSNLLIAILLCILSLTACRPNSKYEHFYRTDAKGWNKDSVLTFPVHFDEDLNASYDLRLNIRNKNSYAYSNLWLFINIQSPNGEQLIDTVEFTLAEPSGRWLGSGLGDLFDNELRYKENVMFPDSGIYRISIQQGMREDVLEGIDAVGLSIVVSD